MIVGHDEEVDGHYVATRMIALVIPAGTRYVTGKTQLALRPSARLTLLALARVWVPILTVAWPVLFGWELRAFIEAAVLGIVSVLLYRPVTFTDAEKRTLRILGSQTGLRVEPARLLAQTRKAKLDMLEALMGKGGLAADPEWLVTVLDEIPTPALPLVYAYARYASDAPPWSTCAERILALIEQLEM